MWCRVFALTETAPEPDAIAAHLAMLGHTVQTKAEADDLGWFHLDVATEFGPITLDRYLASEGIRSDLNTWAAWIEIHAGDKATHLMQHLIAAQQIVTLKCELEDTPPLRRLLHTILGYLARETSGIYQADEEGFFDAAGVLQVNEMPTEPEA